MPEGKNTAQTPQLDMFLCQSHDYYNDINHSPSAGNTWLNSEKLGARHTGEIGKM